MNTQYDFDYLTERRGSGCYKWDADLPAGVVLTPEQRADVIPLWVADMDFPVAPCVLEAMRHRLEHGVFGYVKPLEPYYESVINWFQKRHGATFKREWMLYTTGVVPAISACIKALAPDGGGVIIQTPVYNCFFSSVKNNGCTVVESPMVRRNLPDGRFTYDMDFDDLEAKCADPANKILLLCNPHNPAGRIWSADELQRAGEIALRHGLIVISDEIHCEIIPGGKPYVPFATLGQEFVHGSITLVSPSKSFNFAGLKMATIISDRPEWRESIDHILNVYEICDVNPFGPVATVAAYSDEGADWLAAMNATIKRNYQSLLLAFRRDLPQLPVADLQATYLVWVDTSKVKRSSMDIEKELLRGEQVWINAGSMYGDDGYIRINLACPPALFDKGLSRLVSGLKRLMK